MNDPAEKPDRSWLDRVLFRFLTRGWSPHHISGYRENLKRHDAALSEEVMRAFEQIDVKSTALLAHVSVMIAGLGLIAPLVADNDVETGVIIVEIGAYLLLAIGCLRCLTIFHMGEFAKVDGLYDQLIARELIVRREIYRLVQRLAMGFTVVVFLLLPVLFLWKPEK